MTVLPPLADVVAVHAEDPAVLRTATERLVAHGGFDPPWSPAPGWVTASARLPCSTPDPARAREAGLLFAEGREDVQPRLHWEPLRRLAHDHPGRLDEVDGDVTLLAFDGPDLVGVRAPSGRIPLYVTTAPDGPRTVATTFEHLLRVHPGPLAMDPLIHAMWMGDQDVAVDRRTFVAGVAAVGRGEHLTLRGGRLRFGRHWNPRERIAHEHAPAEHAEALRASLLGTLGRELDQEQPNLVTLSGGVDSSAIAALTGGHFGAPVATLTLLHPLARAQEEERSYIAGVERHVGGFARSTFLQPGPEERLRLLGTLGVPYPVSLPTLSALPEVLPEQPSRVIVGGEFADHVVGSLLSFPDWERATGPVALARAAATGRLPRGKRDLKLWAHLRGRRLSHRPEMAWRPVLPELVRPELRLEWAQWRSERRRRTDADPGPLPYLEQWLERDAFLAMHWETCSALGLRRVHPFVTREVLELAFRMHPAELIGPGWKRPLRAALRGLVPDRNLDRPDKGHHPVPTPPRAPWDGRIPDAAAAVVDPRWNPGSTVEQGDLRTLKQLVVCAEAFERARMALPRPHRRP